MNNQSNHTDANDHKSLFNRVITHPEADDQASIGDLLTQYPYVRALHILNADHHNKPGMYAHVLWDLDHLLSTITADNTRFPETGLTGPPEMVTEEPAETVSVYHDEHLPYSFLWWLNKTRMDYAHTYKPYTSMTRRAPAQWDGHEREVLDQQIRENIFHLQDPEEKLSGSSVGSAIPFQVPKKSDPVIERFIQEEPKISPPRPEKLSFENKARKSASDQGTVVTETLAKIYEEQGLYPKALEVYEKLSLKFPEKSGYFADRIVELKNKLT